MGIIFCFEVVMRVTLPYEQSWTALKWAKTHCSSYIGNRVNFDLMNNREHYVDYFFSEEHDVIYFTLRWT